MKAKKSGFFAGMVLRSLARRLESYLLLVKDEDKLHKGNMSEDVIERKVRRVRERGGGRGGDGEGGRFLMI